MANERSSEAPTGPRDLELKDHIREVERAAADWGVHVDALEGRFIGALLAAIRESGRTILRFLATSRRFWSARERRERESFVGSAC